MLKLNTDVKDTATGLEGRLTHYQLQVGGNEHYHFQPRGINPDTGAPLLGIWLESARIEGGIEIEKPHVHWPVEILGTEVKDDASSFSGTAIALILHTNGCVHVDVQPKGTQKKNGAPINSHDFDIRRISGEKVPVLTEAQREESERENPSPAPIGGLNHPALDPSKKHFKFGTM